MQDPDYQLFTDSVYQELLLALSDQKDKDEKRIDDILDELNLTIYKERHPMSLSGGQKQRTAIGVAALRDAEVLIFDEPTRGIDVAAKVEIYNLMNELKKQGIAVMFVSSEMPEVMGIADRIIVMCDGRITGELDARDVEQSEILTLATRFENKMASAE